MAVSPLTEALSAQTGRTDLTITDWRVGNAVIVGTDIVPRYIESALARHVRGGGR